MSLFGLEDCLCDSNTSRRHKKHIAHYPGKKVTDQIVVVKTIYDPHKTLSKKKYKRLLADSLDGFYPHVPYSLNKRERWTTVTPASLLAHQTSDLPELCVVNKKASDWNMYTDQSTHKVTAFHVLDDDVITTLSATGGEQSLHYYENMLREKRGIDKDEMEPAQMHYSIVSPPPVQRFESRKNRKLGRTDEENRRAIRRKLKITLRKLCRITEAFPNECMQNNEEDEMPDFCKAEFSRKIALKDFISIGQPSTSRSPKNTPSSNVTSSFELVTLKPPKMIDISSATNALGVFEIIDVKLSMLATFDLQEEISLLAPGYCDVHWFGSERVSVASTRSTNPSPVFVIFFELPKNTDILRIRINTNAQFTKLSKATLVKLLKTRKYFPTLFKDLLAFIFTLKIPPPSESSLRFKECKENFMRTVNSTMLATTASRADTFAQLELLRLCYTCDAFKNGLGSEKADICHTCNSPYRTDLFAFNDGMICRECVTSNVLHQIRLNRFPLEIPLDAAPSSPVDLLYAILPISVMSLLSKMSYRYFNAFDYPDAYMVECPQCCMDLSINIPNMYSTCICPKCECNFCYRYFFEKFKLDPGERVLKVKCYCNDFLYVPELGPHFTRCGRLCHYTVERYGTYYCGGTYDQSGILRPYELGAWPYTPRFRKENHPNFEKYGDPVQPEYLEQKKLVSKLYAEVCAEMRRLRFDKTKRIEYENAVKRLFTLKAEQLELIDLRKTVLFLVEHCMAWLYLHRHQKLHHLRKGVLLLFQRFMNFQTKVLDPRYYQKIHAQDVEEMMSTVIKSFKNYAMDVRSINWQ
ncbi:unnamed protein product [Cylicocyclus nassatus]|uniref:Uncharacterized protein n=1 Tax=Cylicocyclus nassatus TaxID=53992 RepID=A0AA36H5H7_CYLNA|nr:unnamed protein product [Cylicocyclus nassatus]